MDDSTGTGPREGSRTIFRIAKRPNFLIADKRSIEDPRLSLRARGLLATLLCKPDDWTIDSAGLAAIVREGRDAIRAAMKELQKAGYMKTERRQIERGRWVTETTIYEQPLGGFPPKTDFQASEPPAPEEPTAGKPGAKTQRTQTEEKTLAAEAATAEPTNIEDQKPAATEEPKPRAPRARDPLWDTFIDEGLPEPQTKSERGKWNTGLKEIRDIAGTPGQIKLRIREARRRWGPGFDLNPKAIANNWTQLGTKEPSRYAEVDPANVPRCPHGVAMAEDHDGWSSACTTCDDRELERAAAQWRRDQHEGAA